MGSGAHRKLIVWQESMKMVEMVYVATRDFPPDERFGLCSQLRRSAVSVPSNIAEGAARNSVRDCYTMSAWQTVHWPNWTLSSK